MNSRQNFLASAAELLAQAITPTQYRAPENWPTLDRYYNVERHSFYSPHSDAEAEALVDTTHRYILAKGGEGGGKSVFGIIKDLERFKRGCNGIVVSPDFEHFKRSLWPEFRRWCPWDMVVPKQRYRQNHDWEPTKPFMLAFETGAVGFFGGIDKEMGWEGPNVNFAHFDEARRKDTPLALKVLDGRVRIPGPLGDIPQMWLTTTPRKHWLFDYFGPYRGAIDPFGAFKKDALVFTLLTIDNEGNLEADFVRKRSQSLSESEIRVLLEANWEDLEEVSHFLPDMLLWDLCEEPVPPLDANTPIVVALDAAVTYDSFGLSVVSRHWKPERHDTDVAVRYTECWLPPGGGQIDFRGTDEYPGPEKRLRWLIDNFNVTQVTFDPSQLYDMSQRLGIAGEGLAWFSEFQQMGDRLVADKQMLDLVVQRRMAHNGDVTLRQHVENADKKDDPESHRLRIVKRHPALKIDLCVATSMGSHRCLQLNI